MGMVQQLVALVRTEHSPFHGARAWEPYAGVLGAEDCPGELRVRVRWGTRGQLRRR